MNSNTRKTIVLTPVKDEEWILDRFLWACSKFADHILILDQQSTDRSREICASFPKVVLIENSSGHYDEAARSNLLIGTARRLFGNGNLLVAFDADEIPSFPSLDKVIWENLCKLPIGTHICFEKPEILSLPIRCVRTRGNFPYGFVDDGSPMEGLLIHSRRTPGAVSNPHYVAGNIILMHFARVRWREYCVRQAVYCMIENIKNTKNHRIRTSYYSPEFYAEFGLGRCDPLPPEWIAGYATAGIDILGFTTSRYNSFHMRALRLFAEHGTTPFKYDPIWWENWEDARLHFIKNGATGMPSAPIVAPYLSASILSRFLILCYKLLASTASIRRRLKPKNIMGNHIFEV